MRGTGWLAAVLVSLLAVRASGGDSPRRDVVLHDGWRFVREDAAGAQAIGFDDSAWPTVNAPHTWNAADAQSRPNYDRGPGWYRKRLTLTPEDVGPLSGKRNYLRFEAASVVADVFVNGQKLGQHRGAFSAFCFDASDALKPGENLITVRVDNSKFPDIAPISGDFAIFGGLYRDVHLLTLSSRSIDPLDDASPGVYLLQQSLSESRGTVQVTTKLRNAKPTPWNATVRCIVREPDGTEIARTESTTTLAPSATGENIQTLVIDHPTTWDGHPSTSSPPPYLYTVTIETLDASTNPPTLTDRITQPLGLRSIRLDPNKGLFLNDAHYPLRGPNKHQDRQDKGWATSHADQDEDFSIILEMGATGVRLAHYQHPDYSYSLCDTNGLLVWAEIPLVDRIAPTKEFAENAKQQLRELIKQNFNHPSIICWGISNELWMGRDQNKGSTLPAELYSLAKSLDPSRPIVLADNGGPADDFNTITDAIAFNRYYGWYVDTAADWPKIDSLHKAFPNRPVGISEYGAGANPAHHEWAWGGASGPDGAGGAGGEGGAGQVNMPVHNGPRHPEEYQSLLHEKAWNVLKTRDWLWCSFFWNMFDFATPVRQEGGFQSRNDKGVVTYDRTLKKDAFYFYKANWSDEPVVYIASRRFSPRPAGITTVKVYSNQAAVELFVNDKSMGVLKASELPDRVFEWKGVELPGGGVGNCRVRAVGMDDSGKAVVKDGIAWMCEDQK